MDKYLQEKIDEYFSEMCSKGAKVLLIAQQSFLTKERKLAYYAKFGNFCDIVIVYNNDTKDNKGLFSFENILEIIEVFESEDEINTVFSYDKFGRSKFANWIG